jgi:D-3-phosphoglycerate dehydrogenase
MAGNSDAFVVAFYAALRLGAIFVPINPASAPPELRYLLEDSGAAVFVHDPAVAATVSAARAAGLPPTTRHVLALPELADLAARADVVTLHAPLTDTTRQLVDAEFLAAMKPTAFLINTARGGLVDHDALVAALDEGRIAGAGLDTFVPEPLAPGHPLLACERALLTPHVAFYSEESVREVRLLAARCVAAVLRGERPAEIVNPEVFG